jgi:hypothetical protein
VFVSDLCLLALKQYAMSIGCGPHATSALSLQLLPSQVCPARLGKSRQAGMIRMMKVMCLILFRLQDVVKQLQLNARDPRAFIDQLNEAGAHM